MKDQQSIIVKKRGNWKSGREKKAKPRISGYIWVLAVVVTLIHIVDRNHYKCKWFYSVKCCG